jgi:hypothetical protein
LVRFKVPETVRSPDILTFEAKVPIPETARLEAREMESLRLTVMVSVALPEVVMLLPPAMKRTSPELMAWDVPVEPETVKREPPSMTKSEEQPQEEVPESHLRIWLLVQLLRRERPLEVSRPGPVPFKATETESVPTEILDEPPTLRTPVFKVKPDPAGKS